MYIANCFYRGKKVSQYTIKAGNALAACHHAEQLAAKALGLKAQPIQLEGMKKAIPCYGGGLMVEVRAC